MRCSGFYCMAMVFVDLHTWGEVGWLEGYGGLGFVHGTLRRMFP